MKEKLIKFCKTLGIPKVGIAPIGPYKELEHILIQRKNRGYLTGFEEEDILKRIDPKKTMKDVAAIIVCAFPYFTRESKHANLSKYTHGLDYHRIIHNYLEKIGLFLQNQIPHFTYQSFVDTGPLVDRYLAYLSGIGYFGWNHQIIMDTYGSYVFIGYMMVNYPFKEDIPDTRSCKMCGKCINKCPGRAIQSNFVMNATKCLSYLTQKKEPLTQKETVLLRKNTYVFGCDVCQDICPHNENVSITPIKEFKMDLIDHLDEKEIRSMSNKGFKRKYGNRAFSWRGRNIIVRNFDIKSMKSDI